MRTSDPLTPALCFAGKRNCVANVLTVVGPQAAPMLRSVRECAAAAVQDGRMTAEAAESLLMRYRARLAGVTYLT